MAGLPVFPSFPPTDANLTRLQQLSAAVAFACRAPVIFHLYKTANQSITSATLTAVSWDAVSADTDGGWNISHPTRYTAQTPGYFLVDFGVNCAINSAVSEWIVSLRVTTGANNPGGAGNVSFAAARGDNIGNNISEQASHATTACTPYLYVLDYIEVVVECLSQNTTITAGWNNSGNNDINGFPDGSPSFTGMLVSLGP
jgi:hypothetical protein